MTDEKWKKLKKNHYRSSRLVITDDGIIDFGIDTYNETEFNGINVSYDEYLDLQRSSVQEQRIWFKTCFYEGGGYVDCKGQIERINKNKDKIVFKRIYIGGEYTDGTFFDGKEEHVWIDRKGFEKYKIGDCLSFNAEVYQYLKTGNGKKLDFAIRNPEDIEMIESYELPSDDDLLKQELGNIVCNICIYSEHCYGNVCIADSGWKKEKIQQFFEMAKHNRNQ